MRRLSLDIACLDAQRDQVNRDALLQGGGRLMVPCLKIADASGASEWLYESGQIIAYLRGRFADA
jgi:glutathione S-transferase